MTPLPPPLGDGAWMAWRIDTAEYADTWDSGEGARRFGGRWNSAGVRAVYAALDPATAILEVAVHKGFAAMDVVPHVLSQARIAQPAAIHVVLPGDVPNPHWLRPGFPSAGQQAFGDARLAAHPCVLLPSVVSAHSWSLIFDPARAAGLYALLAQERFALDGRLSPPGQR